MDLNAEGSDAICSVTEAHWKVHGIMNRMPGAGQWFFRGEDRSDNALIASAGRKGQLKHDAKSVLTVTAEELSRLRRFQAKVQADQELFASVFPDGRFLSLNSAEWWALMQHYESGTRLLDITRSVFAGLFFACAAWTGEVQTEADGAFYLFPFEKNWRDAKPDPQRRRGVIEDSSDQLHAVADHYFDVERHEDTVRFRRSFHWNDRLMAQDCFFLWQPRFDEALEVGKSFKFRIPAVKKPRILTELRSIGYTATRLVRGPRGREAQVKVDAVIDEYLSGDGLLSAARLDSIRRG